MKIHIKWYTDEHDCETCGWSIAQGALVTDKDTGTILLDLEPHAHCYAGSDYSEGDVYRAILEKLGHTIECGTE